MYFKESHIETFEGGADNKSVSEGGTPTGYFLNKYIQPSTSFVPNAEVKNKHHWIIYRYAETLLTYAESMVNAFNDFNYTDNNFTHSAKWAIDEVRTLSLIHISSALLSVLWMTSCSDIAFGDKFLGDQPESSGATLEIMFSNKENANTVLTKAYTGLIYGPVSYTHLQEPLT